MKRGGQALPTRDVCDPTVSFLTVSRILPCANCTGWLQSLATRSASTWIRMSYDRLLNERPHYASRMMVHPGNGNEVHFAANSQSMTIDFIAGGTRCRFNGGGPTLLGAGDTQRAWRDPPGRLSSQGGSCAARTQFGLRRPDGELIPIHSFFYNIPALVRRAVLGVRRPAARLVKKNRFFS